MTRADQKLAYKCIHCHPYNKKATINMIKDVMPMPIVVQELPGDDPFMGVEKKHSVLQLQQVRALRTSQRRRLEPVLSKAKMVRGLPTMEQPNHVSYISRCAYLQQSSSNDYPSQRVDQRRATTPLQLAHVDICGPLQPPSIPWK